MTEVVRKAVKDVTARSKGVAPSTADVFQEAEKALHLSLAAVSRADISRALMALMDRRELYWDAQFRIVPAPVRARDEHHR